MALQLFVLLKILQMVFSYSIGEYTFECEEKGGIMLEGECFIFSKPGDEKSWQDAVEYCYENYGPLATPGDPTGLYDYTKSAYPDIPFWVGGYSPPHGKDFIWINGTQIQLNRNEFPWGPGEPLPPKQVSDQQCMVVNYDEGYASQPCSNEQRYICSLDVCGAMGGVTIGYQCLLFNAVQNTTWNQATEACPSGGKLAIPTYPKLLIKYVHHNYGFLTRFWLGGLQIEISKEDSWYWLNGQPIQFIKYTNLVSDLLKDQEVITSDLLKDQEVITSDFSEDQDNITNCLDVRRLLEPKPGPSDCNQRKGFICELDTSMIKSPPTEQYLIRQISSGEYVGPGTIFPPNDDEVVLHYTSDPNMHMAFDIVYGKWGYIRHVMSGKILSPMANDTDTAPMNPPDGTRVVLQSDRRPWALFAMCQNQNRTKHISGKFLGSDGKYVTITGDERKNVTMEFQYMNILNPVKEVVPYGFSIMEF